MKVILVFIMCIALAWIVWQIPSAKASQPVEVPDGGHFIDILMRIKQSQNVIRLVLRQPDHQEIEGLLTDVGYDYICVVQGGYTSCAELENVARLITPPGTWAKTESGR